MKLQFKLALYNALTKAAIIGLLGILILGFIKNISVSHIEQRLKEKRTKLLTHLSEPEINDFLQKRGVYTDYNLLREEYFTLKKTDSMRFKKERFSDGTRQIDGSALDYHILTQDIVHRGDVYRLEFGEAMATVTRIEAVILRFTLLTLFVAAILTLMSDLVFSKYLLKPFYRIVDEKINKVNDPIHFNYTPIKTSTHDFKVLDESISMLMLKLRSFMLTQKEFIGNVSHELLTPISLLSTRMENILHEETLSAAGENKVIANLKTLNRLKSIINSLLMISKIENAQYLKEDDVSLSQTITEVCEELEHRLLMLNLTLKQHIATDFYFKGNQALIHILLMNIVSNAIKYNVQDGTVSVSTKSQDGHFEVEVVDTGIGMDKEAVGKIFERFEKLNQSGENSHGLGLAIAKGIADFHDITMEVHSGIGSGTSVKVVFPK